MKKHNPKKVKKAWGGRFEKQSHPLLEKFNASISFDQKLFEEDIDGSLAHARMLHKIGLLTAQELKDIKQGLETIKKEIKNGHFDFSEKLEDIHMAIESRLIEKTGATGAKLHTARSRNDQVALDLRLFCIRRVSNIIDEITSLQKVLVELAENKGFVILPGYTHLQRAQPILLAHHFLAYFEMLQRDKSRFEDMLKRTHESPLGSGALAGTTFPIDRHFVAQQLGLQGVTHNSLDAVSDRDFALELLFDIAVTMAHLSRLSEELILWSSQEFNFISLPQNFCTGSSMMPQKINPDVPELIRGKTGRAYGNLFSLLTVMKGLPLAYNKDLQEDKEPVFDSVETILIVLQILQAMLPQIEIHADHMQKATHHGFLLATDLADYLVSKKIPFRQAHEIVGQIVRYCLEHQITLEALSLKDFHRFSSKIDQDVYGWLDLMHSVNRRASVGGTATSQVKKEIKRAKKILKTPL